MPQKIFDVTTLGIPVNTWTGLHGAFSRIGFFSNENLFLDAYTEQLYFDQENGLMYARFTDGSKKEISKKETLGEREVEVDIGTKKYKMTLLPGGMKDETVGYFHDVYAMDNIVGFFK